MPSYCVNKQEQANRDQEVHEKGCEWEPLTKNQIGLGWHATCQSAVAAAKNYYPKSNGCKHCCPSCHTG